eukprot:13709083-Ditylum_brightwellii.AAC.1
MAVAEEFDHHSKQFDNDTYSYTQPQQPMEPPQLQPHHSRPQKQQSEIKVGTDEYLWYIGSHIKSLHLLLLILL